MYRDTIVYLKLPIKIHLQIITSRTQTIPTILKKIYPILTD
ncbi:hypothetical protein ES288_A06G001600v1 [Gossypium darwinii]|uniref:Uncharacterized protein n=2 Tax=Gossypium TaxID=3633 RepID=A0A5D2PXT2_GOSTO|nr:hypothetical protein ES288_A06G001600v1 [Gossypium darwinii]TYI20929.1 hypothetical protein ES332_A06G000700v1 [Gossypium tomentosum]